jgi:hypothetical protein
MRDRGTVNLARDGVAYVGDYFVERGLITVSLRGGGSKTTQVGGSASVPDGLARLMLGDLITELQSRSRQ